MGSGPSCRPGGCAPSCANAVCACRAGRGPSTAADPAGLTARQLEVLALLAEGLSNAQIAERLTVSAKTVDHHVSAVLGKLGVPTRGLAAAAAQAWDGLPT